MFRSKGMVVKKQVAVRGIVSFATTGFIACSPVNTPPEQAGPSVVISAAVNCATPKPLTPADFLPTLRTHGVQTVGGIRNMPVALSALADSRFTSELDLESAAIAAADTPTELAHLDTKFSNAWQAVRRPAGASGIVHVAWTVGWDRRIDDACVPPRAQAVANGDGVALIHERLGAGWAQPATASKRVLTMARWLDRLVPTMMGHLGLCDDVDPPTQPWCYPSAFEFNYGSDPFGAGGWAWSDRQRWVEGYRLFAAAIRSEFPLPANTVAIWGPGVPEDSETGGHSEALRYFLDDIVSSHTPLTAVSVDITAASPKAARDIAMRVREEATSRQIRSDFTNEPVRLAVTDLQMDPESWPAHTHGDIAAQAVWLATFYLGSAILLRDAAEIVYLGRAMAVVPDCKPASGEPLATPADLVYSGQPGVADEARAAASWFLGPYHRFLGAGEYQLLVSGEQEGVVSHITAGTCGPTGATGKQQLCLGGRQPDCLEQDKATPEFARVPAGLPRALNILAADRRLPTAKLGPVVYRVTVPKDVTQAFVRHAHYDSTSPTWTTQEFDYAEMVPVSDGLLEVSFDGPSPGMFFAQAFF